MLPIPHSTCLRTISQKVYGTKSGQFYFENALTETSPSFLTKKGTNYKGAGMTNMPNALEGDSSGDSSARLRDWNGSDGYQCVTPRSSS